MEEIQPTEEFNHFEESSRMGMSSRKSVNLDLEKKRRKEEHRVKNETRTAFSPFIVLLSLSLVPVFIPIREKNLAALNF